MSSETTILSPWIIRHGNEAAPSERIALRAGPLSMVFENGDLRYIRLGGHELIRRIYAMVRDGAWNTYPGKILRIESQVGEDSFQISYEAEHMGDIETGGKLRFKNRVTITGGADGSLHFAMKGISHQRFLSNRIGICVLHPTPDVINTPVVIEHIDGSIEKGVFPADISPTQPFTDIRALTTSTRAGHGIELRFTGAVFEMEDQRNFGDSSFKTFSTPLRLPKPVDIVVGAKIEQELTARLVGSVASHVPEPATCSINVDPRSSTRLPGIGFGIRELEGVEGRLPLIAVLSPSHLHVELLLAKSGWQQLFTAAAALATKLGCALEVGLVAREQQFSDQVVQEVATLAAGTGVKVGSWLICVPRGFASAGMIIRARRLLTSAMPGARIGAGSWSGYCLLNENRPDFSTLDVVGFENNPQGHSADNSTVMENIWAMGEAVASARAIAGRTAVAIAPLRMMPREGEAANNPRRQCDSRQAALFGASWCCGALSRILAESPNSISCFELLGENGLMRSGSADGNSVFPIYHLFADIMEFAQGTLVTSTVEPRLSIAAIALAQGDRRRTLIANLRPYPTSVSIAGLHGEVHLRMLDEQSHVDASTHPLEWRKDSVRSKGQSRLPLSLELLPYASCCIDSAIE